jgi:hypothetical protein
MASGLIVTETVSSTLVTAAVGEVQVLLTQTVTGTLGMVTGPTVAETVVAWADAGLAKARGPRMPPSATTGQANLFSSSTGIAAPFLLVGVLMVRYRNRPR